MRPVLVFALLLLASAAAAEFNVKNWRYVKEISGPPSPGYYAVQLDSEVMAGARPDLSDLRVVAGGQEQPYALQTEADESTLQSVPATVLNLGLSPEGNTVFEIDRGPNAPPMTQFTLDTASRGFRYNVHVFGSHDRQQWVALTREAWIFDSTGTTPSRDTAVRINPTDYRYLQVNLLDKQAPLQVRGVTCEREIVRQASRIELKPITRRITHNPALRTTEVVLDLGRESQPFDTVDLLFDDENVRRSVTVVGLPEPPSETNPVATTPCTGEIFRYRSATYRGAQTRVRCAELRGRFVFISILNGDDRPLHVTGALVYGRPRQLVFRWQAAHMSLYYGSASAMAPQYELPEYLRQQRIQARLALTLGPQAENPDYVPPRGPWTEEYPWILWIVITAAVIAIGLLIINLMTKAAGSGSRQY